MFARDGRRVVTRALGRAALMPAAAFAVHQLRFMLAYGGHAGVVLQRTGHSYLTSLAPWMGLLIAAACGGFLWRLGRALSGQRSLPRYTLSLAGLSLACSSALVAIYVSQEWLEGLLATGHPAGLTGIFGYGGWWAIPAAICVGLMLAAVYHGARWVLHEVANRARMLCVAPVRTISPPRPLVVALPRLMPLAGGWSGRGPPS
jgi:hypothetical protein